MNWHLRYGEHFVLLVKGESVLQGKIDRLIDIDMCYGMEKDVDKITIPTTYYDGSKKTENCGIFQPFGLIGAIITREIEYRISVANAGFNKKMAVFAESWSKNLRNKSMKWYICGIAFCCVETVHLGE